MRENVHRRIYSALAEEDSRLDDHVELTHDMFKRVRRNLGSVVWQASFIRREVEEHIMDVNLRRWEAKNTRS